MLSYRIFGINDFAGKFPSALANMVSALIIFFIARIIFQSYAAGVFASFIYLTAIQVYGSSHQVAADSLMVMTILCSIYFSIRAFNEKKWFIFMAAFFNGLTLLTKSVIGLAVPSAILVYLIIEKRWHDLLYFLYFLLISFLMAAPYFYYAYIKAPEAFVETFLKTNLLNRVASKNGFEMERMFQVLLHGIIYILLLMAFSIPYTPVIFHVFWRKRMDRSFKAMAWNPQSKLLTIYFIVIWIVFSFGKRLLPHYTLSAIPIVAIYMGGTLRETKDRKILIYLASFALVTISAFLIWASREITRYPAYRDVVIGLAAMYVLFIVYTTTFYISKGDLNLKLFMACTIFFIVFSITTAVVVPLDFNADIKSFREVIYGKSNDLVVINTREVNEGYNKKGATKWYLNMEAELYRDFDQFLPDADIYRHGTYFIYYYKYTDLLKKSYDSFTVLKSGQIWNLGLTE
jgi:4-amino-4-deoxy-L-arabinose transferase-like glycosyltransferase